LITQEQFKARLSQHYNREINIAKSDLRTDKSTKNISKSVRNFYKRMDRAIAEAVSDFRVNLACADGCTACCDLRVEVFGGEVIAIANFIENAFDEQQKNDLIGRLETTAPKAKGLKSDEHFMPCALLEGTRCSVYDMRPAMCRKFTSTNASSCANGGQGLEHQGVSASAMIVLQGYAEGSRQAGFKKEVYELNQALLVVMKDKSAAKKWVSGVNIFPMVPEMATMALG